MIIGVVSDTHGQTSYTRQAVTLLEALEVELVIHCGDIGSAQIAPLFARWPTHYVLGNVDHDPAIAQSIRDCRQTCHGRFGSLEAGGLRIAFLHGDDQRRLRETIEQGGWDVVCHGHTHVAEQRHVGCTLVLNPGALYRANPHSIALLEAPSRKVTSITV